MRKYGLPLRLDLTWHIDVLFRIIKTRGKISLEAAQEQFAREYLHASANPIGKLVAASFSQVLDALLKRPLYHITLQGDLLTFEY